MQLKQTRYEKRRENIYEESHQRNKKDLLPPIEDIEQGIEQEEGSDVWQDGDWQDNEQQEPYNNRYGQELPQEKKIQPRYANQLSKIMAQKMPQPQHMTNHPNLRVEFSDLSTWLKIGYITNWLCFVVIVAVVLLLRLTK